MAYRTASVNFSKGWISPELEARFDLSIYSAAMRRAINVKVKRTGGVSKRMGTRFVVECPSSPARLLPFQFSDEQAYVLLNVQASLQPLALGGSVLEEGLLVTAITNAAQAQVTIAYHAYSVGDPFYLSGITGMVEINDRFLTIVQVVDANNFKVDYDSTNAGTFTGSGGGTARVGAPPAPPAPPTVPVVLEPPAEPDVGSGSGGGYEGGTWRGFEGQIP